MHQLDCMKTYLSSGKKPDALEDFVSHKARAADLARLGYKAPAQWNDAHRAAKFCELYAANADFRRLYQEARLGGDYFINLGPGFVIPGLEPKTVEQSRVTIADMIENSSTPSVDYRPLTPDTCQLN
jgi:peptidoglycan/xylan/chitin deacetylase (PgdA/CDA1 family)